MPSPTISNPADPIQQAMVARVRADLAQQRDIRPTEIRLTKVTAVEWRNTSLGCPQPGTMYAQVFTPGYRIVLHAGDTIYEYHTDRHQKVVLCDQRASPAEPTDKATTPGAPPVQTPEDPYLQRMVALARDNLASGLAIDTGQVELLDLEMVTWPDASLGCPRPGMRYKQVPQDGLLIRLRAQGREYEYHSGANRDPFLCEQAPSTLKRPSPASTIPPPGAENQ